MTPQEIKDAFITQLNTNWSATEVAWPNTVFDPVSTVAWIKPWFQMGRTFLGELGTLGVGIRYGIFGVSIYLPVGEGTNVGLGYADTIETLFRRKQFNGVTTDEPSTVEIGEDAVTGLNFYRIDVSVPFTAFVNE